MRRRAVHTVQGILAGLVAVLRQPALQTIYRTIRKEQPGQILYDQLRSRPIEFLPPDKAVRVKQEPNVKLPLLEKVGTIWLRREAEGRGRRLLCHNSANPLRIIGASPDQPFSCWSVFTRR